MWCTSPLQAVFTQPTPVLSMGSDLRSPSLGSQPPPTPAGEQTSLSGWWVLFGTEPLCENLSTLPSAPPSLCFPLWLWSFLPPTLHPRQWRGFLVCGNFSSFTAPSQRCRSYPYSFVSVFSFFFCPTQVLGDFLAFWEVWGLLPAFSRCSVGIVPRVGVFLTYLWGGKWSPCLTPPPSWRPPWAGILKILFSVAYAASTRVTGAKSALHECLLNGWTKQANRWDWVYFVSLPEEIFP